MPVSYAPSSRRCGRVQASRSVAVDRSPMAAWAMLRLGGLAGGDPRLVADATDALALHRERRPAVGQAGLGRLAREAAGEHRVVPVHRPAFLRLERVGLGGDDVGQHVAGRPPSRGAAR